MQIFTNLRPLKDTNIFDGEFSLEELKEAKKQLHDCKHQARMASAA